MTLPPLPYAPSPTDTRPRAANGNVLPPNAGKGRPRGVPNKTNQALKEAILLAAHEAGEEIADQAAEKGQEHPGGLLGYLRMVAMSDVKSFCSLLGRVLPLQVTGGDGGPLEVTFRTVYEQPGDRAKIIGHG